MTTESVHDAEDESRLNIWSETHLAMVGQIEHGIEMGLAQDIGNQEAKWAVLTAAINVLYQRDISQAEMIAVVDGTGIEIFKDA